MISEDDWAGHDFERLHCFGFLLRFNYFNDSHSSLRSLNRGNGIPTIPNDPISAGDIDSNDHLITHRFYNHFRTETHNNDPKGPYDNYNWKYPTLIPPLFCQAGWPELDNF